MKVIVNGQHKNIDENQSLFDLVEAFRPDQRRIIAEINGEIVKTPIWNSVTIEEGDQVELVSLVGGG